jgi:hypothetical protein
LFVIFAQPSPSTRYGARTEQRLLNFMGCICATPSKQTVASPGGSGVDVRDTSHPTAADIAAGLALADAARARVGRHVSTRPAAPPWESRRLQGTGDSRHAALQLVETSASLNPVSPQAAGGTLSPSIRTVSNSASPPLASLQGTPHMRNFTPVARPLVVCECMNETIDVDSPIHSLEFWLTYSNTPYCTTDHRR